MLPGQYRIRLEFTYQLIKENRQNQTITSNLVTISIEEPQGVNREARDYIKTVLKPNFRNMKLRQYILLQQDFVGKFGNTIYGKYIIFDLASTYKTLGEDEKALRELCKISGENFFYSKQVERTLHLIDVKLFPPNLTPLPENAPLPVRPHPCTRLQN